jgi:hypothetical protein
MEKTQGMLSILYIFLKPDIMGKTNGHRWFGSLGCKEEIV